MFHTFLHTWLLIHLFSFVFGSNVLFSPHSVGSPSNLLLGRDEWLGRYCITLPVSCVCACACVHASWLPPPPPTPPACLRLSAVKQERDKLPVSTMFSSLTSFSVCYLLSPSRQPRCHTILRFLGCSVDLLKEVRSSLLRRRRRLEPWGRPGCCFSLLVCALWCRFCLDASDFAAFSTPL